MPAQPVLLRPASPLAERPDSLERFAIDFRALASDIPARIRVRSLLKLALRCVGLVNDGLEDAPPQRG
jgi:hypothetical protein